MLQKTKFAVCTEIHIKYTNSLRSQCRIFECQILWNIKLLVGFVRLISVFVPLEGSIWHTCNARQFQILVSNHPIPSPPPHGATAPGRPGSPNYRGFTITHRHSTFRKTPLDEWSARHTNVYLDNTQHSQETDVHAAGGIRTRNPSKRAATGPSYIVRQYGKISDFDVLLTVHLSTILVINQLNAQILVS